MNIKYYLQIAAVLLVALFGAVSLGVCSAYAEEYEDAPASETTAETPVSDGVSVYNDVEQEQLAQIQETLNQILEVLNPDEVTETEAAVLEDEEVTPTPDPYLLHLQAIEEQLADIEENTTPATAETAEAVSAFEKPFTEYSTTEVLLCILGAVGVCVGAYLCFKEFF